MVCNYHLPDEAIVATRESLQELADKAHKHATSETEYAGAFVPHSLAVMQFSADMALNEAGKILTADIQGVHHA